MKAYGMILRKCSTTKTTTTTTKTITKLAFYDQQVKKSSFHDIDRKVKARSQSHKCNIIL